MSPGKHLWTRAVHGAYAAGVPDSQLVVIRDYRNRAIPRDSIPNVNPPLGTVGDNVPPGFGDTHAMYPAGRLEQSGYMPEVQAWAGWPTGWETPLWNGATYLGRLVSTLWTCIDLNTRQLASFPVYGVKGVKVVSLPEWANNPEPEVYSDWTEFAKQLFNTFQSCGEAILWATGRYSETAGGYPARFMVLNPQMVNVEWVEGEITYSVGGQKLNRRDVCHIKYESMPTNLRGIGPLEWASRSIVSAAAMERMATDIAVKGGIPWGILKSPRKLNGTEAADLQKAWVQGATNRAGAPAVLSGTLELETLTTSPREMALLELRIFDETRIAAALGVPPYLVGLPMPDGLTYANANQLLDFHWRTTLRTQAGAVASALSNWLLPRGTNVEFNRDEYVKADPETRARTYQTLHSIVDEKGNPAMNVDEIRLAERMLPNDPVDAELVAEVTT
jgi:HK97 family phage portal protein